MTLALASYPGIGRLAIAGLLLGACNPKVTSKPVEALAPSTQHTIKGGRRGCSQVRAAGENGTIDDFETDPGRVNPIEGRNGFWFQYDDGTGGKLLRGELTDGSSVLHVAASGYSGWGAGIGASFLASTNRARACGYDASIYSGLRFRARGKGRVRLILAGVSNLKSADGGNCQRAGFGCYDQPGILLELTDEWQNFEQPFCAFLPEGWGGDHAGVDPSELVSVQIRFQAAQAVELWLDDLAFYRGTSEVARAKCIRKCPLDSLPAGVKFTPAVSTATLTEEFTLHTFQQSTTHCGPLERRYLSFVPKRLSARTDAPVLLVLHGNEANAESMRDFMTRGRFDELAARDGFVVVYGNAAPGAHNNSSPSFPNTGGWRQEFFDDGEVDDVDYLFRVIDDLTARGVIAGGNSVYLTGISNGGGMVLKAARQRPERFRGIAPIMAYDGDQPAPAPDLRGTGLVSVLLMQSQHDPGLPNNYENIQRALPVMWAKALGLPPVAVDDPKRIELPDRFSEGESYKGKSQAAMATRSSRATQYDVTDAGATVRLRLITFDHAGHFWPHPGGETADFAIERWGFRNQDINAADVVWDFFSRVQQRGGTASGLPVSSTVVRHLPDGDWGNGGRDVCRSQQSPPE